MTIVEDPHRPAFDAAVLCGGSSLRLGTDKAVLPVDGVALAVVVGRIARAAGARRVVGVGPGGEASAALLADDMVLVADDRPGEGPAAGVVTALRTTASPVVVVLGCDYPRLRPDTVVDLVSRLEADPACAAVVADAGGRLHPTVGAWRVAHCAAAGEDYVAGGGRSLTGLARAVGAVGVHVDEWEMRDVDTPEDAVAVLGEGVTGRLRRSQPQTSDE